MLQHQQLFCDIYYKNKLFILPAAIFILIAVTLSLIFGKASVQLFINQYHCGFSDLFFHYLTYLGDGTVAFILVFALLWCSFRHSITMLATTLVISVLVALIKNLIFPELVRPVTYFANNHLLHVVEGYNPPRYKTFPSGHAATAFSLYFYLAILTRQNYIKLILFSVALFTAFSRMYLSAHFLPDIAAGSFTGIAVTWICYFYLQKIKAGWIDKKIEWNPLVLNRKLKISNN